MSSIPILSGLHPDPSICRRGDDYYLVSSSFEYAPGVPIFHSRDLLRWTQIGNVLDRTELLDPRSSSGSSGILAPSIRHHHGRFYLITTNVERFMDGHLITSTEDPTRPWSDPVYTAGAIGIDPDLSWDDEGVCHLTWSAGFGETQIMQAQIDPDTGRLLSDPKRIYGGDGLAHGESPHVFRRDGWWYLLLAEGGTERGHMATIARARAIDGPFEANPANPILTHRSTAKPVQSTGHADFVETADGAWAAVYLGTRPAGQTPQFHVNGRETFLAGVDWADDWPIVDEDRYDVLEEQAGFDERFLDDTLHPRWIAPGVHPSEIVTRSAGGVVVTAAPSKPASRPMLATRAEHAEWRTQATLTSTGRLTVRVDDRHWAAVELRDGTIEAQVTIGPVSQVLGSTVRPGGDAVTLEIRASAAPMGPMGPSAPDLLELGYAEDDTFHPLTTFDGRYLSTEVAGGFTGRVIGVEPISGAISTGEVRRFRYSPGPTASPST